VLVRTVLLRIVPTHARKFPAIQPKILVSVQPYPIIVSPLVGATSYPSCITGRAISVVRTITSVSW
jgi:hypothetical protein